MDWALKKACSENVGFVKLKHEKVLDFVQYFLYIGCMETIWVCEAAKTFSRVPDRMYQGRQLHHEIRLL